MIREIKINEIEGFLIGNAQDEKGATGCTAICCPEGAVAGVEVRGGGPATRETDLLDPVKMVERIHAVMLCGGSAYGLAAVDGGMDYLEEHNIGFDVGIGKVPIIPAACLFDLMVGDKNCRPDKNMGYAAFVAAQKNEPQSGIVGAGTGATIGKLCGPERAMKSGLGFYALEIGELKIGAIVAVNALGNVIDVEKHIPLGGLLDEKKEKIISSVETMKAIVDSEYTVFQGNTTLGCIITNAELTKAQAKKVAMMSHNGYARAIHPVHTGADGDTVFAMSYGAVKCHLDVVGVAAAEVMAKAVNRAVEVPSAYGFKGRLDL